MIRLCAFAVPNYCNKVKIALLEKGVPFEGEHCMASREPAMLARSRNRRFACRRWRP